MTTKVSSTKSSPITEPKAEKDEERMKAKLEFIKHAGGEIEVKFKRTTIRKLT